MRCHVFFFNDTATTEIYTLSLHDALPIYREAVAYAEGGDAHAPDLEHLGAAHPVAHEPPRRDPSPRDAPCGQDRKSTRLNSSHANISYAVFCLKKNNFL